MLYDRDSWSLKITCSTHIIIIIIVFLKPYFLYWFTGSYSTFYPAKDCLELNWDTSPLDCTLILSRAPQKLAHCSSQVWLPPVLSLTNIIGDNFKFSKRQVIDFRVHEAVLFVSLTLLLFNNLFHLDEGFQVNRSFCNFILPIIEILDVY